MERKGLATVAEERVVVVQAVVVLVAVAMAVEVELVGLVRAEAV